MTPNDLIAAFDVLADAPDGVKRLRELVLSLAVRGRLVGQADHERLGADVVSREPPTDDETPFKLPLIWTWLRLPEASDYHVGRTPPTKESKYWSDNAIPWVSIGDMPDGGTIVSTSRRVSARAVADIFRRAPVTAGTILMSFKLTIGKVAVLGIDAYHNEAIISITPKKYIDKRFLFIFLPILAAGGDTKAAIKGATLNSQSLARILVPVPPLAEQHRIVARVDELMGLLDRLEAARATRDTVRRAARDAALADLRDAPDAEAVETAWGRIAQNMDALFTDPEDVGPLRQAVLGLAVRGRLVAQDPADEPLGPQDAGRPRGWTSGHVQTWFHVTGGIQKSSKRAPTHNKSTYLRVANVQRGFFVLDELAEFELFEGELERYRLEPGDILVVEGNGSESEIGRCARWSGQVANCVHQNHLIRCRPKIPDIEHFTILFLNSPDGMQTMRDLAVTTSGLYNLSVGKIKSIIIPVPPRLEQNRIVTKVESLMSLCDALEARLTAARDLHRQFAAAAVHHLDM